MPDDEMESDESRRILHEVGKVLDLRGCVKPPAFSSKDKDWHDFRWRFGVMCTTLGIRQMLSEVEKCTEQEYQSRTLTERARVFSRILYGILVSACPTGQAAALVRLAPEGDGFAVWRSLIREFEPQQATRHISMLSSIMAPRWRHGYFLEDLLRWEQEVREYEIASTSIVPDSMRMAIVMRNAPPDVRAWMRTTEVSTTAWHEFRSSLNAFLLRGRTFDVKGDKQQGDDMEVGNVQPQKSFQDKSKGKGKGQRQD